MLRLHAEANAEDFPGVHHPKYTKHANPLHRLGEELLAAVSLLASEFVVGRLYAPPNFHFNQIK